jgi:hypothetical protein
VSFRLGDHTSRSSVALLDKASLLLTANDFLFYANEGATVAAPRGKTVCERITTDVVRVTDFACLHELYNPADTTAELETCPRHTLLRG